MNLYLLDAYNLLFRSFCSLPGSIVDAGNAPINAVYGLLAFMIRLRRDFGATHMIAAFDTPEVPTFRHVLYPGYQAQRGPLGGEQSDEFLRQVGVAARLLPNLGVPSVARPGFEADDVMGTLAQRARSAAQSVTIVSTDRDVLQLVDAPVRVAVPGSSIAFMESDEDVVNRIGVPPSRVTAFKALAGDASDNIPGVRGIGAKTAATLVNEHHTLANIYAHLDGMSARTRGLLEAGRDDALLFYKVVTIVTDLELLCDPLHIPEVAFSGKDKIRPLLES